MKINTFFKQIGTIRSILILFSFSLCPVVFLTDVEPEGLGILPAYIAPALVVIFFFLLLLDALMNRVFMIDQELSQKKQSMLRIKLDLFSVASLVLFWWPYFSQIGAL
tara:strand:- start:872 stop:1195 length:324 start_codon:yes stop_codon:yes gene_type:complete